MRQSRVKKNHTALSGYIASMQCALAKAQNGSIAEDMYFVEKLTKMANRMGYDLTPQTDAANPCEQCVGANCGECNLAVV